MRRMLPTHQRAMLVAIVLMGCAFGTQAQSGRRSTVKSTPTAPPVEVPVVVTKPQKAPRLQLLLVAENPSPFDQTPYYLSDTVVTECARRLEEAPDVLVNAAPGHMNRAEAAKAAKAEKERFVVWLQLGNDNADSSRQVQNSSQQLYVSYTIYEPGTGKIRLSGRTHNGMVKVGNVGVGVPPTTRDSRAYSEYLVKQSAREAAERILGAFGIKVGDNQRMPF